VLNPDQVAPVINAVVTFLFGIVILYNIYAGRSTRHFANYSWGLGFLFYAFQIVSRVVMKSMVLTFAFGVPFYIFFIFGVWSLARKRWLIYALITLVVPLTVIWFSGLPSSTTFAVMATFFYGIMTAGMTYNRLSLGRIVDKLLIGWFLLLLTNLLLLGAGWITDLFAVFGKFILLLGVLDQDFAILIREVRRSMEVPPPATEGRVEEGGITLLSVTSTRAPLIKISEWLERRVKVNISNRVETNILVLQNVLPYSILRKVAWINPRHVHIFIFSENVEESREFTTLKYEVTKIGATISEIVKKYREIDNRGEIILVDLSVMIHTFGAKKAYSLLLNKMGLLRSTGTGLIAVVHPETHDSTTIALFKTIADNILTL